MLSDLLAELFYLLWAEFVLVRLDDFCLLRWRECDEAKYIDCAPA